MKAVPVVRVTKEFNFEMGHALYGYDGPCKNIHGHSYKLSVTVKGKVTEDPGNNKWGMVMDYSDLKKIVEHEILTKFDHALVLNDNSPHKAFAKENILTGKIMMVNYQPTCENLLMDISNRISEALPATIKLHHLRLRETPTSFAEWFAEDNESHSKI